MQYGIIISPKTAFKVLRKIDNVMYIWIYKDAYLF